MTLEEYNNLSPEEQNALVATEVLGWELNEDNEWVYYDEDFDNYLRMAENEKSIQVLSVDNFDPKHDLSHAFMLVDKLLLNHYFMLRHVPMKQGDVWEAWFIPVKSGIADTPNQAIMLACLRAKGVVE